MSARKAIRYVWYEHILSDRRHFLLRLAAQDMSAGIYLLLQSTPDSSNLQGKSN